ncbi:unnamed protein product [Adineta steineri]|uniref:Uncharacterized protein n=1 Tax=Adineta steineri TaxID=433720 RepID=A0A815Q915_9BILA|nr:unnamed protein product [Adineta steineri]
MSVRSDVNTTAKLNKIANHINSSHYDDENIHYNNHYNYSNEYYQQQRSTNNKRSKRVGASIIQNQPQRKPIGNGSNNNNFGHHSISDNDQKESKEWE